jgi:hypothetical protein
VGNLPEGTTLFGERIVDTIPMQFYTWDEVVALHRTRNTFRDEASAAPRIAPYKPRSLRRS